MRSRWTRSQGVRRRAPFVIVLREGAVGDLGEYRQSSLGRRSSVHRLSPRRTSACISSGFVTVDTSAMRFYSTRLRYARPCSHRPCSLPHQFLATVATSASGRRLVGPHGSERWHGAYITVRPNPAFERTRRQLTSTWRSSWRRAAQLVR